MPHYIITFPHRMYIVAFLFFFFFLEAPSTIGLPSVLLDNLSTNPHPNPFWLGQFITGSRTEPKPSLSFRPI